MKYSKRLLLLVLLMSTPLFELSQSSIPDRSHPRAHVGRALEMLQENVQRNISENEEPEDANATTVQNKIIKLTPTAETGYGDRQNVFTARRNLVKETCARNMKTMSFGGQARVPLDRFRWLKKRDLVVCLTAKVGSSTWLRYLLEDRLPELHKSRETRSLLAKKYLVPENITSKEAVIEQLMNSTRITNVRHPFCRLVSAFRNIFEPCATNTTCAGRLYFKEWRTIVTFRAFVEILLKYIPLPSKVDEEAFSSFDRHWRPYYLNCGVCDIDFDYIVKMETWDQDIGYILDKHGFQRKASVHANNHHSTSVAQDYFKTLPRSTILQLYEYYHQDFELFGYSIDEFI